MRRLQRVYFRAIAGTKEKRAALNDAQVAERMFDAAVAKLKKPRLNWELKEGHQMSIDEDC